MEVSGTLPVNFLVVTRVLATTIALPLLIFYGDFLAFIGSYAGLAAYSNISLQLFFTRAFESLHFIDIIPAVVKSVFFGFFIGIVSCYKGYYAEAGTEGVGKASNSAVVVSSLVIFLIDLLAVQLTNLLM
jgi:phospholipid/cholesterol/gamma-HCH transport system permease protein